MKHEWQKQEKDLYGAKQTPAIITVPMQNYIMKSGKGKLKTILRYMVK